MKVGTQEWNVAITSTLVGGGCARRARCVAAGGGGGGLTPMYLSNKSELKSRVRRLHAYGLKGDGDSNPTFCNNIVGSGRRPPKNSLSSGYSQFEKVEKVNTHGRLGKGDSKQLETKPN